MIEMSLFGRVHNVTFYVDCKESLEFTGVGVIRWKKKGRRQAIFIIIAMYIRTSMGLYDIV